jgi:hypothetical protein
LILFARSEDCEEDSPKPLLNGKVIGLTATFSRLSAYARRLLIKRRALCEAEQFLLAALFAAIVICYLLTLFTLKDWSSVLATWPIFSVCLLFAGLIGVLARLFGSIPWGLLAGYVLLALWLFLPPTTRFATTVTVALPSALYIAFAMWRWRAKAINYVWLGCLSGLTLFATRGLYSWADIINQLHAGALHQDTLFHAAIASMIKTYGSASTGLNGLVEINYHVFSHRLFAAVSGLSGAPVLAVYGLAPHVLLVPILLFSLSYAATSICKAQTIATAIYNWSLACVLLVALPGLFSPWALWDSFFVSESYLIALGMMCVALPFLARRCSSISEVMFAGVVCSLAAISKGSVGLILACLFLSKAVFYAQNRRLAWLGALMATIAVVAVSETATATARSFTEFDFFHLVWTFTEKGQILCSELMRPDVSRFWALIQAAWLKIEFLGIHFLLSWIAIAQCARVAGQNLFRNPSLMLNAGALAFSASSVFLLSMPAGAVYYFSNCALFVAMPFVTSSASTFLETRSSKIIAWGSPVLALIAILAVGSDAVATKFMRQAKAVDPPLSRLIHRLENLRLTNVNKETVFVPSPELLALNTIERISARPFLYPAVSERAWTGVLSSSPDDLKKYQYYGYQDYVSSDGTEILPLNNENKALIKQRVDADVKIVPLPANY